MADSACYIELASNAGDFFTNAAQDDILIHPHYATQNILLGTSNSQIPSITVTSNAVGIFESYPSYALDVQGDINFTGTFRKNGTPYVGSQWSNDNSNVFLGANSNVGIGLSNPAYPLDVNGDINFTGTFRKNGTPYVGSQWSNNNSNVFLGADSNVGIGISNPYERFMINGNCLVASNDAYISATAPNVPPSLGICKKSGSASMFVFTSNYNNTFNNSLKFGMLTGTHLSNIATVSPVEYMVLTNSGNLGIGNSAPAYKLDVTGDIRATSNIHCLSTITEKVLLPSGPYMIGSGWDYNGSWVASASNGGFVLRNNDKGGLEVYTGRSNDGLTMYATFTSNGNFALGGSYTPSEKLDVTSGNIKSSSNIYAMHRIGIGKSNLTYSLDVLGDTLFANPIPLPSNAGSSNVLTSFLFSNANYSKLEVQEVRKFTGSNWQSATTRFQKITDLTRQGYIDFGTSNDGGLAFGSSTTEAMVINSVGNVGIAKSNPMYKLDVNGDINYTGTLSKSGVALVGSQWTSSACNVYVGSTSNVGIGTTAPGYTLHVVGTIYTSGDIIAFSDERAKSNLEVIPEPLSKVRKLTGYTYDIPESLSDTTKLTSKYTGLIAQQVMQVLPEAVHKDTDGKLSIAYGNIMGLVVEAIKEVDDKYKEEIQTLKNQMAQVMSKIENLYT